MPNLDKKGSNSPPWMQLSLYFDLSLLSGEIFGFW